MDEERETMDDMERDADRKAGLRRKVGSGVAIAALIGASWYGWYELRGKYSQSTNDAYVRADFVTVSPRIAGYVADVFVAENQTVKAGQPLVRISSREYEAATSRFDAEIALASANAGIAQAAIDEQRAAIDAARAELERAAGDAAHAAAEVARYEPLASSGAETRERLDMLRNSARQAVATLASRKAMLASAERRLESLRAQVRQADAQGRAARAQRQAADVDLAATVIRASIDGRVGSKTVRVGQFTQPGARLMTLVPTDTLHVEANFKETQVGLMRVGQPVKIHVDAFPGIDFQGRVASIAPGTGAEFSILPPQNATGNFTKIVQRVPIRIAIDGGTQAQRLLIAGMSVEATVDTRSGKAELEKFAAAQQR